MYYSLSLGIEVVLSIVIILLILLCRGKGADVGAAFSGGASASVFGSRGSVPFTTKLIGILCALFLINSLVLTYFANRSIGGSSVIDKVEVQRFDQPSLPAGTSVEQKSSQGSDIPILPVESKPPAEESP